MRQARHGVPGMGLLYGVRLCFAGGDGSEMPPRVSAGVSAVVGSRGYLLRARDVGGSFVQCVGRPIRILNYCCMT